MTLQEQVEAFEKSLIERTLTMTDGNVRASAKALGTAERTLWDKLGKHEIDPKVFRPGANPDAAGIKRVALYVSTMIEHFKELNLDSAMCDLDDLSDRLYYGGWKTEDPRTAAAVSRALITGSLEHL